MSASKNARERLALALRRNRGAPVTEQYLGAVSAIVGCPFRADTDLLPLEATDELFAMFSHSFRVCTTEPPKCVHLRFPAADSTHLFSRLAELPANSTSLPIALFGKESEYTGALRLQSPDAFLNAHALLQLEVDGLRVATLDGSQGFLLDYLSREQEFEFWLWGDEWMESFRSGC